MKRSQPLRMCVGCRQMKEKAQLIRIVKQQGDILSVDLTGKINGRGAYTCRDVQCLKKAFSTHALERSFHMKISEEDSRRLEKEMNSVIE